MTTAEDRKGSPPKYAIHLPDEEGQFPGELMDWSQGLSAAEIDDWGMGDQIVDELRHLLPYALLAYVEEVDDLARVVRLDYHDGRFNIVEVLDLSSAFGPDASHVQALHRSVIEDRFQSHPMNERYVEAYENARESDLIPDGWDEEHAAQALANAYADGNPADIHWVFGSCQIPGECMALLARHLIGKYECWQEGDYLRATAVYRMTIGSLHPDDPELRKLDLDSRITRDDLISAALHSSGDVAPENADSEGTRP